MKVINFVSTKETDPFTAMALNVRFTAFLLKLAAKLGEVAGHLDGDMGKDQIANILFQFSSEILLAAEIPQDNGTDTRE